MSDASATAPPNLPGPNPDPDFWRRKLLAFLHDPPSKALHLREKQNHEDVAVSLARQALAALGWDEEADVSLFTALKDADWTASAADRVVFPTGGKAGSAAETFTGHPGATFRHPLGGSELALDLPPTAARALEILQNAFGGIKAVDRRQLFFFFWRRWMEETAKSDGGRTLAYLPADTRIPDHTIWTHMSVTSALQACRVGTEISPAFLVFQLGPVQDFIAAARSTRDLWSGSYLLSWLTASAIKAVTDVIGPDCVIFPALRGQGIFDVLHRDLYQSITYPDGQGGTDTLWERMYLDGKKQDRKRLARLLLNPTLPNRFLALVPTAGERAGETLARRAEQAVLEELGRISAACYDAFAGLAKAAGEPPTEDWRRRWDAQVHHWPQIAWTVVPWEHDIPTGLADFARLPMNQACDREARRCEGPGSIDMADRTGRLCPMSPHAVLDACRRLATELMLVEDRDYRYHRDGDRDRPKEGKTRLNNAGFLWSANVQTAEFCMAARRNTRDFEAFATDPHQEGAPKDALTGKEEIIGSRDLWLKLGAGSDSPFKDNEGPYGAITLIKRLWYRKGCGYLLGRLGLHERLVHETLRFESVPDVACGNEDGYVLVPGERKPRNPYVAVIAMDGDEMGKWIAGAKTPRLLDQLADSARPYFKGLLRGLPAGEALRRPLSPSYHMQFSEALANFANHVAGRIVHRYDGQLVYAGGDDVLAMVPADKALSCAQALRAAFRGCEAELPDPANTYELAFQANGFLLVEQRYPILVPGPSAEVSCGLAIGHCRHPLQALVREALAAEKRAKKDVARGGFGRGAFAISLLKRGGETVHWGARWDSPALGLHETYRRLRGRTRQAQEKSPVSAKFPYALAALLQPYCLARGSFEFGFDPIQVIPLEFERILQQQAEGLMERKQELREPARRYLEWLQSQYDAGRKGAFAEFETLFLAAAFLERDRGEEE